MAFDFDLTDEQEAFIDKALNEILSQNPDCQIVAVGYH